MLVLLEMRILYICMWGRGADVRGWFYILQTQRNTNLEEKKRVKNKFKIQGENKREREKKKKK